MTEPKRRGKYVAKRHPVLSPSPLVRQVFSLMRGKGLYDNCIDPSVAYRWRTGYDKPSFVGLLRFCEAAGYHLAFVDNKTDEVIPLEPLE